MEVDTITNLKDISGSGLCRVRGWVEKITIMKKHTFIVLRDGVGTDSHLQIYLSKKIGLADNIKDDLVTESYIEVTGQIRNLPVNKFSFRPFEMEAIKISILGASNNEFVSKCPASSGNDVKLELRHLYLRDPKFALVTKLRSVLVQCLRDHFEETGCTEIFPPSFVGNQCEGGATLFNLDYPDKDKGKISAHLTQSSQFYLEYALPGVGDCYCISPSFRAEKSQTRRHLTEFLHAEVEWNGIITFEQHLNKLKHLIKNVVNRFLTDGQKYLLELGLLERVENLSKMCDNILILSHHDAITYCRLNNIYKDSDTHQHFDYTDDIPEMQERALIDAIGKIVFLVKFPKQFKSFYFLQDKEDGTVFGCDIEVVGVGEIVGSGMRVYDEETLRQQLKEQGLKEEDYQEYIDLRKYGSGRTSGMGLGVDRFLTWLLGSYSIREVVTFPRYPGKLFP